jgi:hypothetical protein
MTYAIRDGWIEGRLPGPDGTMIPVEQWPREDQKPWSKLVKNPPNLCLHTTEGTTSLGDAYKRWEYPPNFAVGDGKIVQLFPLGYASEAVDAHDHELCQIEIPFRVASIGLKVWLPPSSSLHPLVALVAFLHDEGHITTGLRRPTEAWPVQLDRGPQASESYYRRNDGTWPKPGVYGHVEIPADEHWDPGSFDYPRFFEMVSALLGSGEDEMFKEWLSGWDAHQEGKQLREEWASLKKQGWRDREQVIKEAVARLSTPPV